MHLWNLFFGLTKIRFVKFFWGTFFGILPGTILLAFAGDSLLNPTIPLVLIYLGIIVAIVVIVFFVRKKIISKRKT